MSEIWNKLKIPLFTALGVHCKCICHGDQIVELQFIIIMQHLIEGRVDSSNACMRAEMKVETKLEIWKKFNHLKISNFFFIFQKKITCQEWRQNQSPPYPLAHSGHHQLDPWRLWRIVLSGCFECTRQMWSADSSHLVHWRIVDGGLEIFLLIFRVLIKQPSFGPLSLNFAL